MRSTEIPSVKGKKKKLPFAQITTGTDSPNSGQPNQTHVRARCFLPPSCPSPSLALPLETPSSNINAVTDEVGGSGG